MTVFQQFVHEIEIMLTQKAADKGYSTDGPDGPNPVNTFMAEHFPDHAPGEVCYKMLRWRERHNVEDLVKAAAWAYLIWREHAIKAHVQSVDPRIMEF